MFSFAYISLGGNVLDDVVAANTVKQEPQTGGESLVLGNMVAAYGENAGKNIENATKSSIKTEVKDEDVSVICIDSDDDDDDVIFIGTLNDQMQNLTVATTDVKEEADMKVEP